MTELTIKSKSVEEPKQKKSKVSSKKLVNVSKSKKMQASDNEQSVKAQNLSKTSQQNPDVTMVSTRKESDENKASCTNDKVRTSPSASDNSAIIKEKVNNPSTILPILHL